MAKRWNFETGPNKENMNRPYILLRYSEAYGYGNFESYVCYTEKQHGDERPITYSDYTASDGYTPDYILCNLQATAQRDLRGDLSRVTDENKPYAFRLEYKPIALTTEYASLEKVENKVKFLQAYCKRMQELQNEYGYAQDFAQWLIYVSKALNVEIARYNQTAGTVDFLSPDEVRYTVRDMMTRTHQPA